MPSPELLARFSEAEPVARGGMGCIEAALDPVIGRRVAIKTLRDEYRDDHLAVAKFAEEARITGQLEHPNVIPIYDFGGSEQDPFIVMRLVQGKSLAELFRASPQPANRAEEADLLHHFVRIVLALCDALAFAHGRGVFHCDVKPDNVMVGEHGQVYLMDWGTALTNAPRDRFGGTAAYMAPEQLLGKTEEIDERTDVFGLGGVLYELLTGTQPNDGTNMLAAARGQSSLKFTPRQLWSRLPPELCRIAARALAPNRADRYQSARALRRDLEQFLKGGGWFESLAVNAGECIVTEGEPGDAAFIILSGSCQVWKTVHGERRLLRTLQPGDVFGEAAVFAGGTRTATIVAASEVTLKVITGDALNRELDQNPILAAFVRSLANLFRETDAALSARGADLLSQRPPPVGR